MSAPVVDGLSPARIFETAVHALRRHHGDRAAAAAGLRLIAGTPYRGPSAQLSDELIPSFYHQAADVLEFRQRRSAAERWPRPRPGYGSDGRPLFEVVAELEVEL